MTAPVQDTAVYSVATAASARAIQLTIRARLMQDVAKMWPALDSKRLSETWPSWRRAMSLLVGSYHRQSSVAASASYRAARTEAIHSPTPSGLVKLASEPSPEWLDKAFGYSGPGLLSRDTAQPGTALSTTLGTASRIALEGGRVTVAETIKSDPVAVGWFFLTDGDPCHWCAVIASRGIVYKEHSLELSNAKFVGSGTAKIHNGCGCVLAPAFSQDQPLPEVNSIAEDVYVVASNGVPYTEALASFRRAWGMYNATPAGSHEARMAAFREAWKADEPARDVLRATRAAKKV